MCIAALFMVACDHAIFHSFEGHAWAELIDFMIVLWNDGSHGFNAYVCIDGYN